MSQRASASPGFKFFDNYAELIERLLGRAHALAFLDADQKPLWTRGAPPSVEILRAAAESMSRAHEAPGAREFHSSTHRQLLFALITPDGKCRGYSLVTLARDSRANSSIRAIRKQLAPLLECIARELAATDGARKRTEVLSERTTEMEWLLKISSQPVSGGDNGEIVARLVEAAADRLGAEVAALLVPAKRMTLVRHRHGLADSDAHDMLRRMRRALLDWASKQHRPLVVNKPGKAAAATGFKILAVPVRQRQGHSVGTLVFLRSADAKDFGRKHAYLARHLSGQITTLLATQFDVATGLYTRPAWQSQARELMRENPVMPCAVVYVDVDRMHVLNENHGFEVGDEIIIRVAQLLQAPLLPLDALPARITGDRFAIFLVNSSTAQAVQVAVNLQRAIGALSSSIFEAEERVSVSCGVAPVAASEDSVGRALALAEVACKAAKDHGRGRVEVFQESDASMVHRQADISAMGRLRDALRHDRLTMFAQKILPLRSPEIPPRYELLMRALDDQGRPVTAAPLLSAAQRYQVSSEIDAWVVPHALHAIAPYRAMLLERGIGISINVTGQSFGNPDFAGMLRGWLAESKVPPGILTFEITETAAVSDLARADAFIRQFRALGCRFALDDFGIGVNSLVYLKSLRVNCVKIDGSFVHDMIENPRSEAMVRAIAQLAQDMNIETVAEYVESEEIMQRLRQLGVDYAQGFAVAHPEPLLGVLQALQAEESARMRRVYLEA